MGEHYDYWGGENAAAAAVPDTGDDTLRQALTRTIGNHTVPIKATLPNGEQTWPASIHILIGESEVAELADALLPRIREHVAAAVQAERERIATEIEATYAGRHIGVIAKSLAARIARGTEADRG